MTKWELMSMVCDHKNNRIWEPHLAGARKCYDCGMVKSPNRAHYGGKLWDWELIQKKIGFKLFGLEFSIAWMAKDLS